MRRSHKQGMQGGVVAPDRRQRGFLGAATIAASMVVLAIVMSVVALIAEQRLSMTSRNARQAYLSSLRDNLQAAYANAAADIDVLDDATAEAVLRNLAQSSAQYALRFASTKRLGLPCTAPHSASCVAYHDWYVWMPPASTSDTTTLDAGSGIFTPARGALWVKVSGRLIEQEFVSRSVSSMSDIQTQLRGFFQARAMADANRTETNYFRDSQCSAKYKGALPCVDTFTDLLSTAIPADLGIDRSNATNAWGYALQVSNQQDSAIYQAPYSMAIRSQTPWGYLEMAVAQPN